MTDELFQPLIFAFRWPEWLAVSLLAAPFVLYYLWSAIGYERKIRRRQKAFDAFVEHMFRTMEPIANDAVEPAEIANNAVERVFDQPLEAPDGDQEQRNGHHDD